MMLYTMDSRSYPNVAFLDDTYDTNNDDKER